MQKKIIEALADRKVTVVAANTKISLSTIKKIRNGGKVREHILRRLADYFQIDWIEEND